MTESTIGTPTNTIHGTNEIVSKNVSVWKKGNRRYIIEKPAGKKISKAILFDRIWLDADNSNDEFIIK